MSSIFCKVKPQLGVIKENIWERKNICFLVHICIYFYLYLFPDVFVCFCSIFAPRSRLSLKSDYSLRRQAERIYHFAFFTKDRWMGGWMNGWMVHFNQIKNTKTHLKHSRTYWILHLYIADAPCFNFIKSSWDIWWRCPLQSPWNCFPRLNKPFSSERRRQKLPLFWTLAIFTNLSQIENDKICKKCFCIASFSWMNKSQILPVLSLQKRKIKY